MLAPVYEVKDELKLFFETQGKQDLLLSIKSKEFHLTLASLLDIFEAFNDLNLILQDKNIDCTNDSDAISVFVEKLELGMVAFKEEMQFSFLNLIPPSEKVKLN